MKLIVLTVFLTAYIIQLCALPAADPAAAATTVTNATSEASATVSKALNASQVADASNAMSKLFKGSNNPLQIAQTFMTTIFSACQNFLKSVFGFGSVPGMDKLTNMSGFLNPVTGAETMGKEMFGDALKMFSGAKGDNSSASDAKASGASSFNPLTGAESLGKDIFGDALKMFSGDKSAAGAANATKAANATTTAKDATSKDIVSETKDSMGSLLKEFGL